MVELTALATLFNLDVNYNRCSQILKFALYGIALLFIKYSQIATSVQTFNHETIAH